jgi:hypothetical protein
MQRTAGIVPWGRVDPILLGVAMVLHSYCPTAYKFGCRYIPFPDESTIRRHYNPKIKEEEKYLSDLSQMAEIVRRRVYLGCCTIAVDTISLDSTFLAARERKESHPQPSYAFVYELLPLSTNQSCFAIHVMPSFSINATPAHDNVIKTILHHFIHLPHAPVVTFIATDGDSGYSHLYLAQFHTWFSIYLAGGIVECNDWICGHLPLYV